MDYHTISHKRIPLIPDAELLRLIDEITEKGARPQGPPKIRGQRTRLARRMEAISREIKARGLTNPPWWSVQRDWEIEDLPTYAGSVLVHTSM